VTGRVLVRLAIGAAAAATLALTLAPAVPDARLGPLAGVFRHLDFHGGIARLYRKSVGVDRLSPHATPAVADQPLAGSNKHELRTRAKMPVALGGNKAHQELVPGLERILRPAIRERVPRTHCLDAPHLLFTLIVLQRKVNLDVGIGKNVLRHRRLRGDAMRKVIYARGAMMRE